MRFYATPANLVEEQNQFERDIAEYVSGEINPVKFKAIRVAHGVYEQRQEHTYMIRIRCAAGGLTPSQLRRAAELAGQYGSGEVHFTTRQEIQVHEVLIDDVMKVIRGLLEVGLSTRGGGGNTIRNILTSVDSGISLEEEFDVDPYAVALTTRMIFEPDSWNLPRKFKIAFSNSLKDTSFTQTTCLGFVAEKRNNEEGFQVYCAGGMGAKPMIGHPLIEWVPGAKAYQVTKALKQMFDVNGNRRSKFSSRIKFLWKKVGDDEFKRLFNEYYNLIKDDASLDLKIEPIANEAKNPGIEPEYIHNNAFEKWRARYVFPQKQDGLFSILIPLRLGDLVEKDAYLLTDLLEKFGDNTIRCDRGQNIRLRNIPETYLGNVFSVISRMQTLSDRPYFIGNMINCTGAQTCKLGICLPRGLSDAIRDRLDDSDLNLDEISDFRINMSGCPNTCGMHHIADLGFFGKIGRKSGDLFPAYNVLAGAKIGVAGETQYAERVSEIPAKHIPEFVYQFLKNYISEKENFESYQSYLESKGKTLISELCDSFKDVPELAEDESYYIDFGAKRKLSVDELGSAECSAGMFDMIDVDKRLITSYQKSLGAATDAETVQTSLYKILFSSARMLLVTRGLEGKTEEQVFELFGKHFVQTELVDPKFLPVVQLGKSKNFDAIVDAKDQVLALAEEVEALYKSMDDSLRFKKEPKAVDATANEPAALSKDFRGVACPMNFVKTKLVLETLQSGQQLEILLDDGEPIQNVPNSVKLEGHKILKQEQTGPHWTVLIEKK